MTKLDAIKPDKIIVGTSPPEIWIRTGSSYVLAAVYPQVPRIISSSEMSTRAEKAFKKGSSFVCVYDPLVAPSVRH